MPKFQKLFGENPEVVRVNSESVEFDAEGIAEVSDEAAEVLAGIPWHYALIEDATVLEETKASEDVTVPEEEEKIEVVQAPAAPKAPSAPSAPKAPKAPTPPAAK